MSKKDQIPPPPEAIRSTLKSRGAREVINLSLQKWLQLTQEAKTISTKRTAAQVIREMREER